MVLGLLADLDGTGIRAFHLQQAGELLKAQVHGQRVLGMLPTEGVRGGSSEGHLLVAGAEGEVQGVEEMVAPPAVETDHLLVDKVQAECVVFRLRSFFGLGQNSDGELPLLRVMSEAGGHSDQQGSGAMEAGGASAGGERSGSGGRSGGAKTGFDAILLGPAEGGGPPAGQTKIAQFPFNLVVSVPQTSDEIRSGRHGSGPFPYVACASELIVIHPRDSLPKPYETKGGPARARGGACGGMPARRSGAFRQPV